MERTRPFWLFYLLVIYVGLQFAWWSYLLIDLNDRVHQQKAKIHEKKGEDKAAQEALREKRTRFWMVVGEGSVFLVLLILGFSRLRRSFAKELGLARQEKNFLMAVTHELKTPLSSVKLYLETLQKRDLDPTQRSRIAEQAIQETDRLNGLVENVLMATRIESGNFQLDLKQRELPPLIRETLQTAMETIGKDHNTHLELEEGVQAEVDPDAFASILLNLYENAVKYSPSGSTITVSLKKEPPMAVVRVMDEGSGVSPSTLGKLTEKFYRAGNEETRKGTGTGLGLFIVKALISQHKGKFWVEPRKGATGSCFCLGFYQK